MLKLITVFLLMTMFVTGTIHGQTLSDPSKESRINLRQAIARETEKLKNESAAIDVEKIKKMRQQSPQKSHKTRNTLILTALVVVLVGLAVVLAHNSKRCIRRNPSGCNFADDINCQCIEYEK